MELTLNEFVVGVVLASLLSVAGLSLVSRFRHWRTERRLEGSRTFCRLCGHVFISGHGGDLNHCEACDALNLTKRNGKLG